MCCNAGDKFNCMDYSARSPAAPLQSPWLSLSLAIIFFLYCEMKYCCYFKIIIDKLVHNHLKCKKKKHPKMEQQKVLAMSQ